MIPNSWLAGRGRKGLFCKKVLCTPKKLYTIGVAGLYKAKAAGQSPAALTAPANASGKKRK